MNKQQIDNLIDVLLGISAFLIMLGALLKLEHIQNGTLILWIGFISSFILSNFEISRLKKVIKNLNRDLNNGILNKD
jgi:undecaprenyl pyrophosphate phosphatase UppP